MCCSPENAQEPASTALTAEGPANACRLLHARRPGKCLIGYVVTERGPSPVKIASSEVPSAFNVECLSRALDSFASLHWCGHHLRRFTPLRNELPSRS